MQPLHQRRVGEHCALKRTGLAASDYPGKSVELVIQRNPLREPLERELLPRKQGRVLELVRLRRECGPQDFEPRAVR
jgi:hypothetical protein